MSKETARTWAVEEFGCARLGDSRRRLRLIAMATEAARHPNGKVSEVFNNAAARQGAYGLLESRKVARLQLTEAMCRAGARRCSKQPFVYVAVDGSSVTLTDTKRNKGFGCVGDHAHGARGLKVLSALLISPQGVPLGLGAQIWWRRSAAAAQKHRDARRTGEKETIHWLEAMAQTRHTMRLEAPRTRCWFQLDREGDAWPILMEADQQGHWFTIRGHHDRRVRLADGSKTFLRKLVCAQAVKGRYELPVPGCSHRAARIAKMVVRACEVTLDFRDKRTKRRFPKTVNVVWTREEGTTPAGEKPIDWLLLTNRPITSRGELTEVVRGYAQRWRIEEFHRTWKSGACDVEEMQLRDAENAEKWATILAAVAVRVERLKRLSRNEPQRPASDEFSRIELKAIALLRFGEKARKKVPARTIPTIGEAVLWVAEIGGYTGKSSGGPPGSITINRGLRDVLTVARAITAMKASSD